MDRPVELVLSNLWREREREKVERERTKDKEKKEIEKVITDRGYVLVTAEYWPCVGIGDAFRQTEMESHVLQSRFVMFFTVIFSAGFIENARFSLRGVSSRECGKPFSCVVLQDLKESLRGWFGNMTILYCFNQS